MNVSGSLQDLVKRLPEGVRPRAFNAGECSDKRSYHSVIKGWSEADWGDTDDWNNTWDKDFL